MPILSDIHNEKVKLVRATFGNRLGQKITSGILMPILNELEESVPDIMETIAEWTRNQISEMLKAATPTGRSYKIYDYDPSRPYGQRSILIDEYTASSPGELPANLTGTLAESIEYEIYSNGSFRVGLLKNYGVGSDAGSEFESAFYRSGKIIKSEGFNKQTPVGSYGRYLNTGTEKMKPRPWFSIIMGDLREQIRKKIRFKVRAALNRATRRVTVKRAIVFKVYFQQ